MIALLVLVAPLLAATGGPDAFGTTWIDSFEPGGPSFDWVSIRGSGMDTELGDDDEYTIPLPFTFFFYGGAYTQVSVGDGALLLGHSTAINNRNQCIPGNNGDGDDALILPLWDDLNTEESPGGGVFWEVRGTSPARQLVVQYEQVPHYGSSTLFSFQVILSEGNNSVLVLYQTATGDDEYSGGSSATVGVQQGPTLGLEYSCETDALTDGLAILFDVACEDLDGDGYGACDGDCDDGDPAVGPTIPEADDGVDNDCDGVVDEDFVAVGDVVINEMMPDPLASEDQTGEWFELANVSDRVVDLYGWTVSDSAASLTIDRHLVLAPGGLALFAAVDAPWINGDLPSVDWVFDWDALHLNNNGDSLVVAVAGLVIDRLSFTSDPWVVPEGASMFLDPGYQSAELNDSPLPWCTTPSLEAYDYGGEGLGDYGTPGEPNPEGICCHDDDGDGWDVCDGDCDDTSAARFPGNPELRDLIDNDCDDVADEDWLEPGSIVITELMDETRAVEQSLGEWFELLNVGSDAVNLRGWRVTDSLGEGFDIDQDLVVEPGEHLLFAVEGDSLLNGGLPTPDWVYSYELFPLRSYDDDDIQVLAGGALMDRVGYRNVDPWDSQAGQSLYLCPSASDVDSNDDAGWWGATPSEAAYAYGLGDYGTPGAANPGDIDGDGDGAALCDGDCDDRDASVGPGSAEDCTNGQDDDCDGAVDGADEDCLPQDSGETDTPADSGGPGDDDAREGCGGCSSGGGRGRMASSLAILLAVLCLLRRGAAGSERLQA